MSTPDELRSSLSAYVEAVNSRDPGAIAARFTEDAVHADPVSSPPNIGRAAIAAFFERNVAASEDWTFSASSVHTCGESVAIDFAISVRTGGTTMTIAGIEIFTADEAGLFRTAHAYWDDADVSVT